MQRGGYAWLLALATAAVAALGWRQQRVKSKERRGVRVDMSKMPSSGAISTAVGRGHYRREAGERLHIELDNGQQLLVPAERVSQQPDGQYWLDVPLSELRRKLAQSGETGASSDRIVIPIVEEELSVGTRTVDAGGVRVTKKVHQRQEWVEGQLRQDELQVERVPVNEFVAQPESVQQDGDRLIVPIYEEVLVVEKRLRLKERLIITRAEHEEPVREAVTRREEEVEVERLPAQAGGKR